MRSCATPLLPGAFSAGAQGETRDSPHDPPDTHSNLSNQNTNTAAPINENAMPAAGQSTAGNTEGETSEDTPAGSTDLPQMGGGAGDFLSAVDRILGRRDASKKGVEDGGEGEGEMEPFMPHHFLRSSYMLDARPPSSVSQSGQPRSVTAAAAAASRAVAAATKAVEDLRDPSLMSYVRSPAAAGRGCVKLSMNSSGEYLLTLAYLLCRTHSSDTRCRGRGCCRRCDQERRRGRCSFERASRPKTCGELPRDISR